MDTKRICPTCGKTLATGAPEGLCPECLLKAGFGTGVDIGTDTGGKAPRFVPPKIEELAAKFPQLEILAFIGQGGMGAVYKARQKQLDRIVALKILPPQPGGSAAFAERFTREARALARLSHQHIVTLYEFGQTDGLFYFLMEFVDGVNLRQLLNTSRMASKEALAIVPQICEALQFAHDSGIVHRDIKPENILLDKKGQVKIADFGVAKMIAESLTEAAGKSAAAPGELTEAGSTLGTPQYMAPEQIKNSAEVDHRADIYSLGVVFYQMLTGDLPSGKIEPPSRKVHIDVRLDEIVLRALEKKPELRFQQVSDVKTMVETIATTPQAPPPAPPAVPPGWKHYQDSRWGYELDIPAGWNPFPPVHSNSPYEVIRFMSHEKGAPLLILFRKPRDPTKSLKDAADKVQQSLAKTGFGNFVSSETTIGSKPAQILDFDRAKGNETWSCREYFMAEGALGYTLGFGTTDKAGLFETFDRIAKSFRFKASSYEHKGVEISSLGYGQEMIRWFPDPKTKTAAANEPPPDTGKETGVPAVTARIEIDVKDARTKIIAWGIVMALGCIEIAIHTHTAWNWFIALWGVLLFFISTSLSLLSDRPKHIRTAALIVCLDGIGVAGIVMWGAYHVSDIDIAWRLAIVGGAVSGLIYALRALYFWTTFPVTPEAGPPRSRLGLKFGIFIGIPMLIILALVMSLFVGVERHVTMPMGGIPFHFRVFEADADLVDQLVPHGDRHDGVQPHTKFSFAEETGTSTTFAGNFSATTHGSTTDSQMAFITQDSFNALLPATNATSPGMLADRTRFVSCDWWFPGLSDGWSYSLADDHFAGSGGGNVLFGVRENHGIQVRIEGLLDHSLDREGPGIHPDIHSRILYQGPMPYTNVIVFLVHFFRHDGSPHYLVTAFDFYDLPTNEESPEQSAPNRASNQTEPSRPSSTPTPKPELSFGPTHIVVLDGSDKSFLNLATGTTFPAYLGTELDHWKQANGIDLSIGKSGDGKMGVTGPLSVGEIANDRWAEITPGELIHADDKNTEIGDLTTNVFLSADHTYTFLTRGLDFGILQARSVAGNPQEVTVLYKIIHLPVTFGPVIERTIDVTGTNERALNLGSQNYITAPPQLDEREFFNSTDDLRTAGADLYCMTNGEIQALDMRFWDDSNTEEKDAPPAIPNPWTDVPHFPPLLWWISKYPLDGMDTNSPDYLMFNGLYASDRARRLQPHEDSIRGPEICLFTTRDGVDGILQIVNYESYDAGHTRAIIRYRLVQQ